jgi:hypothetical protein
VSLLRRTRLYISPVTFFINAGQYAILHFKELFILDGKTNALVDEDIARRNSIVNLLEEWKLLEIIDTTRVEDPVAPLSQIKVLSHREKSEWALEAKYMIGKKKVT